MSNCLTVTECSFPQVKQTSVELLSTQGESLQMLCEATEARLAELQAASEAQRAAGRAALERSHAETGRAVAEGRDLARALEAEKAARTSENEQAARELARAKEEKEASDAKNRRELEKLESGVAAIASGRGRLEQLKELHEQMDKKASCLNGLCFCAHVLNRRESGKSSASSWRPPSRSCRAKSKRWRKATRS
jgi:DNA repair exonuclease SbcCD ATPase subunit